MGNEHWVEVALENLCTICTGKRDVNEGNPEGKFVFFTCAQEPTKIDFSEFSGEAILIAGNGFFNVKYFDGEFNAYQRTYVLQNFKISSRYLYLYIKFSLDTLTQDNRGTTVKYIRLSNLQNHLIPLPPFNEQKRIVEKLDAVLPKIRQSRERLEKIPIILKKFRQSVLAAACSGRLTEEWRAGENLPEWEEKNMRNVITTLNYGTSKKCEYSVKDGLPVLRIPNVSSGKLSLDDLKYTTLDKKERAHYSLESGDLLMIRSNGSVSLLGLTVVADDSVVGYAYAGYLICLKCNKQLVVPNFLYLVLNSNKLRTQIELPARSTTGVHNINSKEIRSLSIPLPPLPEQQEIVRRVETLFAFADSLEEKYQSAISRVNKIEQAVLAKAFRGELAEADPNDEPAEELLERILMEKGSLE